MGEMVHWMHCPCGNKRGFGSEHDADKALGRAQTKRNRQADKNGSRRGLTVESRTYYCEQGDTFHLTSQSRRAFNEVRASR